MKTKVTLLGDSIRLIGYGLKVPEMLGDTYEVYQPEDNCRFVKYTLRGIFDWKQQIDGSDIIHWNNGLWDVCRLFGDGTFSSVEEYTDNILRVARLLKKITPNIIFATTTPVRDEYVYNKNEDIKAFNDSVVPLLKSEGIIINDLFSVVYPNRKEYVADDLLHLSEKGIEVCSKMVTDTIKAIKL